MTCRDARIPRGAGCAFGARGARRGRFGHSLSSRGIRTSLCVTEAPREAWGYEREQGTGSTGEAGGGDRRESLVAAGKDIAWRSAAITTWHEVAQRNTGGGRRRPQAADNGRCGSVPAPRRRRA